MAHGGLIPAKRGYIANITVVPPIIYPFQYNPKEVVDEKKIEWKKKESTLGTRGLAGVAQGAKGVVSGFELGGFRGFKTGVGRAFGNATEIAGRTFSAADMLRMEEEKPRELTFKFAIDGRERRPGEPERRRNDEGNILADLAIIRSFVYPQFASDLDILSAIGGSSFDATWSNLWFNHPPTMTLVMGDRSTEGFVAEMKITETQWNEKLDPVHAEVEIKLQEKVDSFSFAIESVKRLGRMAYQSSYTDLPHVLGF
jgi:hypothetical protein